MRLQKRLIYYSLAILMLLLCILFNTSDKSLPYFSGIVTLQLSLLLSILFSAYQIFSNVSTRLNVTWIDAALITLSIYLLLALSMDPNHPFFSDKSQRYLLIVTVYFFLRIMVNNDEYNMPSWMIITMAGLACCIHGLIQLYQHMHDEDAWLSVKGSLTNSALYTCFILMTVPGAYLVLRKRAMPSVFKITAGLNIVLAGIIVLFITFSKAALIAGTGALVFVIHRHYDLRKYKLATVSILSICLIGLFLFTAFKPDSSPGRLLIWNISATMWLDSPVTGLGINQFASRYNEFQAEYFFTNPDSNYGFFAGNTYHAFNEYLEMLVEGGLAGLATLMFIIATVFAIVKNNAAQPTDSLICSQATLLIVFIFALFSYPFNSLPVCALVAMCLGLLSSGYSKPLVSVKLPIAVVRILFIAATMLLATTLYFTSARYSLIKKWETAYLSIRNGHTEEAFGMYKKLFPLLHNHGPFLFNYGAELSEAEHYSESIEILNKARQHFSHIDLYLYLGKSYEGVGDFSNAAAAYRHAAFMIPNRFVPKYLLAKLYIRQGDAPGATRLAQEIMELPVKAKSKIVNQIRNEMKAYLENKDSF